MKDILMKKISCILLFIAVSIFAKTIGVDETNDFRGVVFAESIAKYSFFNKKSSNDYVSVYTRQNDKLLIGDIKIRDIEYTFFKDKFYRVGFYVQNRDGFIALLDVLRLKYGKEDNRTIRKAYYSAGWNGKKISIIMSQLYESDNITENNYYVDYSYIPFTDEINKKIMNDPENKEQMKKDKMLQDL